MSQQYNTVVNALEQFSANHLSLKRFKCSFFEQMDNFSTSENSFPILYAIPNNISFEYNIDVMSFRVYCVDVLQKDRSNEQTILNETLLILRDLNNWFKQNNYNNLNVLNNPRAIPVNNFLTEFTTGWYIDIDVEVEGETNDCSIPFSNNFILTGITCDTQYVNQFLTCDTLLSCDGFIDLDNRVTTLESIVYTITGAPLTFSGTTNYYSRFTSGGTISNGIVYDNGGSHLFVAPQSDNATLGVVSPSGFYYPSLYFYNNGGTPLGGITAYNYTLYIAGHGASQVPLQVSSVVSLPYLTGNSLTFLDSSSIIRNVTLGSNLSFSTGGTLSVTGLTSEILTVTSSASIVVDINAYDVLKVTALAVPTTISITGTMQDAKRLLIEIKDNGTAQGVTFSGDFVDAGGGLLTTTTANKWYHGIFIANTTNNKLMSVGGVIEP